MKHSRFIYDHELQIQIQNKIHEQNIQISLSKTMKFLIMRNLGNSQITDLDLQNDILLARFMIIEYEQIQSLTKYSFEDAYKYKSNLNNYFDS